LRVIKDNRKIAAVVVTYNNVLMLKTLLDDLLYQTRMPDEIIVIDNSNNDLTKKTLREEFSNITYLKMLENMGSEGGYYEGIKIALENDNDLILTLDDDVRMLENSLEELLNGLKAVEKKDNMVGVVRGVGKWHKDNVPTKLDLFAWRGALIKSAAIRKVGLPIKEYFIYGGDLEYSLRLSSNGYRFFWVPRSKIVERRIGEKSWHKIFGKKIFFYTDEFRLYYAFRNEIHLYIKYGLFFKAVKTVLYGVKIIVFFIIYERLKGLDKIRAVIKGLCDGFQSKLGKNTKYLPG
jgi:GT2 family glycosyltransferase